MSMDWFKGKSTGNHRFSMIFPWNMGLSCNFSLKPIQWTCAFASHGSDVETTASPGPELVVSKDHLRADTAMRIQDQGFRMRKAGLVNPMVNPCESHPSEYLLNSPKDVYPGLSSGEGGRKLSGSLVLVFPGKKSGTTWSYELGFPTKSGILSGRIFWTLMFRSQVASNQGGPSPASGSFRKCGMNPQLSFQDGFKTALSHILISNFTWWCMVRSVRLWSRYLHGGTHFFVSNPVPTAQNSIISLQQMLAEEKGSNEKLIEKGAKTF